MSVALFEPLTIRGTGFRNRVFVAPMCQYSAKNGLLSQWHTVHYGALSTGGNALVIAEATGVVPEGRISVGCAGIWSDELAEAFRPIIDFAHSQNTKFGIQLAHAGRKASTTLPGSDHAVATPDEGGWQVVAPSPLAFYGLQDPKELTTNEIHHLVQAFADAAKRAVNVGFDVIEIHAAHGYLLHQFLSPLTNHRSDEYGGDFAGRTRFTLEVAHAIRAVIPDDFPLFIRISATDWVEGGWDLDQSIELCKELKRAGVDLIDVSTGGLVHDAQIPVGPAFQTPFATAIKEAVGIPVSSAGLITEAEQANEIIASGKSDAVELARAMLRNPRWALDAAHKLGGTVQWPQQLIRGQLK